MYSKDTDRPDTCLIHAMSRFATIAKKYCESEKKTNIRKPLHPIIHNINKRYGEQLRLAATP